MTSDILFEWLEAIQEESDIKFFIEIEMRLYV